MSLPLRRPPSLSWPSSPYPEDKQSPSVSRIDKKASTPRKQTSKPFATPIKTASMSQAAPSSSPLSSPPFSLQDPVTPRGSSPPTLLSPGTPTRPASPVAETHTTITSTSVEAETEDPTSIATTSNMARKRAQPLKTRTRKDDDESDSPPPKKAASPVKAKAKAKKAPKKPAAKKTAPPPPPSTRPSRNRRAPDRFEDLQEAKPVKAPAATKTPAKSKVFDSVYITTNSTSRLGKADVYHMLLEPAAWTSLSAEQQITLLSMLPQDSATTALIVKTQSGDTEGTRPALFHGSNDCFRTDVAKFQEDLKNGHLAKTWQASAEQAVIERAAGEYDEWKAEESELWWGQKS